ncbi:MAG: DsrE family protein [Gammaproteobacteria bacterium]|nr:DsrE family protein [Gammaproteobacteria bacterium]
MHITVLLAICIVTFNALLNPTLASDSASWGTAKGVDYRYAPQKVLYDLTTGDAEHLKNIMDRVGLLYKLYDSDPFESSIVVIIHGDSIPFFSIANTQNYELMKRAYNFTLGSTIEFRMCQAAAKVRGYEPRDIHGFVKMVPMADAEIVKLQKEGYAYMQ